MRSSSPFAAARAAGRRPDRYVVPSLYPSSPGTTTFTTGMPTSLRERSTTTALGDADRALDSRSTSALYVFIETSGYRARGARASRGFSIRSLWREELPRALDVVATPEGFVRSIEAIVAAPRDERQARLYGLRQRTHQGDGRREMAAISRRGADRSPASLLRLLEDLASEGGDAGVRRDVPGDRPDPRALKGARVLNRSRPSSSTLARSTAGGALLRRGRQQSTKASASASRSITSHLSA